jgi:hypothetical protein
MTGAPNGTGHGPGDDRVRTILTAPEAVGQEAFAQYVALETEIPLEAALQALRVTPYYLEKAKQQRCGRTIEPFSVTDMRESN